MWSELRGPHRAGPGMRHLPPRSSLRPVHLLVDPTPGGGGIAAYGALAAPLLEAALGREVRQLKRAPGETLGAFRRRVAASVAATGPGLAEVEAPESGAATLLLPPGAPVHVRLHMARSVAALWEGRVPDPAELAAEQAVVARAACVSAPSRIAVAVSARLFALPATVLVHPNPAPAPAPRPAGSLAGGPRLLVVGRAQPLKGSEVLRAMLPHLPPHSALRLVGRGTEALARRLGGPARARGLGEIGPAAIAAEIEAADALLVPSLVETFCMAAAEAVALGRPVAGWSNLGAAEWFPGLVWSAPGWEPATLAAVAMRAVAAGRRLPAAAFAAAAADCRAAFAAGAREAAAAVGRAAAAPAALPVPPIALLAQPARPVERVARKFLKLVRDPRMFLRDSARNRDA